MNQDTKIVIIHEGYAWYLPYVLYQAKFASPNSDVVLIGDNLEFEQIHVESLSNFEGDNIRQFKRYYSHMSTNPKWFEIFCFLRWFYLLNYMRKYQIQSVLHLDSDVLLYSSIEDIKDAYFNMDWKCAYLIPKQDFDSFVWTASPHVSYWTIDALEDFCSFIINSFKKEEYLKLYQKKWDWHQTQQKSGGICDMTTLYLYWEANSGRIINLAKSHKANVFDHNINISLNYNLNQYLTEDGLKKVHFVNNKPFFFRDDEANELDRVHALHLQGGAKKYIKRFYIGKLFRETRFNSRAFFYFIKNKIKHKIIR